MVRLTRDHRHSRTGVSSAVPRQTDWTFGIPFPAPARSARPYRKPRDPTNGSTPLRHSWTPLGRRLSKISRGEGSSRKTDLPDRRKQSLSASRPLSLPSPNPTAAGESKRKKFRDATDGAGILHPRFVIPLEGSFAPTTRMGADRSGFGEAGDFLHLFLVEFASFPPAITPVPQGYQPLSRLHFAPSPSNFNNCDEVTL